MKSFYQLLFQNETLFRSQEIQAVEKIVEEVTAKIVTESTTEAPVREADTVPTSAPPVFQTPTLNHQE